MHLSHGMYDDLPRQNVNGYAEYTDLARRYNEGQGHKSLSSSDSVKRMLRKLREHILSGCANLDAFKQLMFPEEIFDLTVTQTPVERSVRDQLSGAFYRKASYGHPTYGVGAAPLFEKADFHIHSFESLFRRLNPKIGLAWTDYKVLTAVERTDTHTNICFTQSSGNGEILRRYAPLLADEFFFATRDKTRGKKERPRELESRVFVHVPAEYGDDRQKRLSANSIYDALARREEFRMMNTLAQKAAGQYVLLDRLPAEIDYGFYKNYKHLTTEHQRALTPEEDMDYRGFALRTHFFPQVG